MAFEVPDRFLAPFQGAFPSEDVLADLTTNAALFGQKYVAQVVQYTTSELARVATSIGIPPGLYGSAEALFDGFDSFQAAAMGISEFKPLDIVQNVVGNFSALASALGAFQSVPILGIVVAFADFMISGVRSALEVQRAKEIDGPGFLYSEAADDFWCEESLIVKSGRDWTRLFMPVSDAANGIEGFNVELASSTKVQTKVYVPQGNEYAGALGVMPTTSENPRGWMVDMDTNAETRSVGIPWAMYMPGFQQAGIISWQGLLTNTRACYLVDAVRLRAAWEEFWSHMILWGWGTRYKAKDQYRFRWFAMPIRVAGDVQSKIPLSEYGDILHANPLAGNKPGQFLTFRGVVRWAIEQQLMARQRAYLSTLTVAYVSERDPAFNDPELLELLRDRRTVLLTRDAKHEVDMDRVVDGDYRSALAAARQAGPSGGVKTPEPSAPQLGSLAGTRVEPVFDLAGLQEAKAASAAPALGGSRSGGGAAAAALAILGLGTAGALALRRRRRR